jgi:cytochrome c
LRLARRIGAASLAVAGGILVAGSASAGDAALGEYLSSECVTCHQASGHVTGGVPSITAWPEDQFVAVLTAYKSKLRDNPTMQTIAGRLSDEDIAALAAYFEKLPAPHTSK